MTRTSGSTAPAPVCGLVEEIEEAFARRPGKPLSYSTAEALGLLVLLRDIGRAGRIRLSRLLGLGEQSVRSLIRLLETAGLVERSGWGLALSRRARLLLDSLRIMEALPRPRPLEEMGWRRVAFLQVCLPRAPGLGVGEALLLRDRVVSWGGRGAVVMVVEPWGRPRVVGGEGGSAEAELSSSALALGSTCPGVVVFIGFDHDRELWGAVYGFLEGLCGLLGG